MDRRVVAVAYSGGRDSTALLHATLKQAAELGGRVIALHVHHGLSPNADAWLAHCEAQCSKWARAGLPVQFAARRLTEKPQRGESIEAWARRQRYRALRAMAIEARAQAVLLAHHRRDQAETVLLQALRGAGTAGLAGMPARAEREGVVWLRPWLARSRGEIEAYVRAHRLKYIDDESNADERYARNRLRARVWPALEDAFADAEASLADSAAWAAEATAALDELAQMDLASVSVKRNSKRSEEGAEGSPSALDVAAWYALSPARRSNALRHWLMHKHRHQYQHESRPLRQGQQQVQVDADASTPASLVVRLLDELPAALLAKRIARWPHPAGELRLYRGLLTLDQPQRAQQAETPACETSLSITRAGSYRLPGWGGVLRAQRVREGGVPLAWLGHVELRERQGAEQFQSGIGRPPRSLKKQFQSAGVAAWDRNGPLVYSGGQLIYVPGLGIDARVIGLPGQPMLALNWQAADKPAKG